MRNWIKAAPRPDGKLDSAFRTLCIKLYLTSRKGGERVDNGTACSIRKRIPDHRHAELLSGPTQVDGVRDWQARPDVGGSACG